MQKNVRWKYQKFKKYYLKIKNYNQSIKLTQNKIYDILTKEKGNEVLPRRDSKPLIKLMASVYQTQELSAFLLGFKPVHQSSVSQKRNGTLMNK